MVMMIAIDHCLPSSLGCSLAFELLLTCLLQLFGRSAAAPDPHAALMHTPRAPIAYYHTHQAPKVGSAQTGPTGPLPT